MMHIFGLLFIILFLSLIYFLDQIKADLLANSFVRFNLQWRMVYLQSILKVSFDLRGMSMRVCVCAYKRLL